MDLSLKSYEPIVGPSVLRQLRQLAAGLSGLRVIHVNSTSQGGGVAEILSWMIPLMKDLGLEVSWEVIQGTPSFFRVTKAMHNGLQGTPVQMSGEDRQTYLQTNEENAETLRDKLEEADFVWWPED